MPIQVGTMVNITKGVEGYTFGKGAFSSIREISALHGSYVYRLNGCNRWYPERHLILMKVSSPPEQKTTEEMKKEARRLKRQAKRAKRAANKPRESITLCENNNLKDIIKKHKEYMRTAPPRRPKRELSQREVDGILRNFLPSDIARGKYKSGIDFSTSRSFKNVKTTLMTNPPFSQSEQPDGVWHGVWPEVTEYVGIPFADPDVEADE